MFKAEAYIAQGDHLAILEDILNETAQEYAYLLALKKGKKVNLGQELTDQTLREIFPEVAQATQELVGVTELSPVNLAINTNPYWSERMIGGLGAILLLGEGVFHRDFQLPTALVLAAIYGISRIPPIHHKGELDTRENTGSYYNHIDKRLVIGESWTVPATGTIAHEYTHHLQNQILQLGGIKDPFIEGSAMGVENVISHLYAQTYDNSVYAFGSVAHMAVGLKHAYLDTCKTIGRTPHESLRKLRIDGASEGRQYSLGAAVVSIAGVKHGTDVYKDLIAGNYSFLQS